MNGIDITFLKDRLSSLRYKCRVLLFICGLSKFLVVSLLYFAVTFLLDWSIPELPSAIRLLFLFVGIGLMVYNFYRYVIKYLSFPMTDTYLSYFIEKNFSEFNERFITVVQLAGKIESEARFNSPELLKFITDEVIRIAKKIDFNKVINLKPLWFSLLSVFMVFGSASVFALNYRNYVEIWFNRLLGREVSWPKKTRIFVLHDKIMRVARGDKVIIQAKAEGRIPSRMYLYTKYKDMNKPEYDIMLRVGSSNIFNSPGIEAEKSFAFYVEGGDNRSEWFQVEVLPPPEIEKITSTYEYPSYLGKGPGQQEPTLGGNIKAPIGTKVTLSIYSSIPLAAAHLELLSTHEKIPMEMVSDNDRVFKADFYVWRSTDYILRLYGKNGIENKETYRYSMIAVLDQAPSVKIVLPRFDTKFVVADGLVPVKYESSDDYGISKVSLILQKKDASGKKQDDYVEALVSAKADVTKDLSGGVNLELSKYTPVVGDTITFHLLVEDNCDLKSDVVKCPHQTASARRVLSVVEKSQLQKRLEEQILGLKVKITQLQMMQKQINDDYYKKIFLNSTFDAAVMSILLNTQFNISNELVMISDNLDEIISDAVNNKIWDDESLKDLRNADLLIRAMHEKYIPDLTAKTGELKIDFLNSKQKVYQLLDDIYKTYSHILKLLTRWEDYQEVVRLTRTIIKVQEDILDTLKGGKDKK